MSSLVPAGGAHVLRASELTVHTGQQQVAAAVALARKAEAEAKRLEEEVRCQTA